MLRLGGIAANRAAAVGFHVHVDAAVTEDEARGGQHRGVCAKPPAQRTVPAATGAGRRVSAAIGRGGWRVLLQVEGGRRSRQRGEGLHGALVVRRVPPLQELQEEDAQREGGGEGHGRALRRLGHQPPRSLHQAAHTRTTH